ncbi:MAG: tetratricopeptide repeat protein [Candidatus Eisenbacteria bacterium]|nr:tetratricopeptide repeat protein [Candidatus Eisenbacteria bacterium]MCC7141767.1 tetratricopeptide repeat protein [Candidatus Eisenbacteria bacterium]
MSAGQFLLLLGLLLGILALIGLPLVLGQRREAEPWNPGPAYLAAIDGLVRGQRNRAVEALRRIARQEPENLDAYLRLGDLLRAMGHAEKAQRIHHGLAARPVADPDLSLRIRESLLLDYVALRDWDETQRLGETLRGADRQNLVALQSLAAAYVERGDWGRAIAAVEEWERLLPGRAVPRPEAVRLFAARRLMAAGEPKEARRMLEETLQRNGSCGNARILLGDLWAAEGEHEKAAEQWLTQARQAPNQAAALFPRLERSYFELGRFGDLLQVYESLGQSAPGSAPASIALAEMHKRRGRPEEAIHILQSLLATHGDQPAARRLLARCYLSSGRADEAMRELDELLAEHARGESAIRCPRCAVRIDPLDPRCGSCGQWLPEDAA